MLTMADRHVEAAWPPGFHSNVQKTPRTEAKGQGLSVKKIIDSHGIRVCGVVTCSVQSAKS